MYQIGIDIGSTTAKMAVVDAPTGTTIYSNYARHHAQAGHLISTFLRELQSKIGDAEVTVCVTGSVGMAAAEQLRAPFIQEVVAATVYAHKRFPQAKTLIDIGGEDAKAVFFNGKNTELRMNGNCAGGTGAFIDQMSTLMGIDNTTLDQLAANAKQVYPMAARCGVFAKTDVQNFMSRNLPQEDIAASIFHSIAVQTVTSLAHGCQLTPPILLCGGPLTFLPSLRKAFEDYLGLPSTDFIVTAESNLIPALGCALSEERNDAVRISDLQHKLEQPIALKTENSLVPLFTNEEEHEAWRREKQSKTLGRSNFKKGVNTIAIGIDSGSTTTKIVALDTETKQVLFSHYAQNLGNPLRAVSEGLAELQRQATAADADLHVLGSCSTGYGEALIKAAFHLDYGIIETMAHYRAAESLQPNVSFILDIGGQDMKAIFVDRGTIVRMELNEACSSGCGTFIQTFATTLGYGVEDFAQLACTSKHPCDLGTRCTVFMNSKVKQVMREGAQVADIAAGLAYSVVRNCLYKVLKLRGNDDMGAHIVVQGGTMKNDAVVRAFELQTGCQVSRSEMPELMGAVGCALEVIRNSNALKAKREKEENQTSSFLFTVGLPQPQMRHLQCKGCENQCSIIRYTFEGGGHFYSGNKCERVFNNNSTDIKRGSNLYVEKYQLLFNRKSEPPSGTSRGRIGIPRALNIYEEYPFWNRLLRECGFEVVLSSHSRFDNYERALGSVMSDNICFPAKLVHAHIAELEQMGVDRILMPYVVYEYNEIGDSLNSYNCPIVSGYSDVIKSAMSPQVTVDSPVINFSDFDLLEQQIVAYLKTLGVSKREARQALTAAIDEQRAFAMEICEKNHALLEQSRHENRIAILLAGRPYHSDPLIQHKLSEMIAALGVDVLTDDIVRIEPSTGSGDIYLVKQWAYINRIVKAAQWASEQDNSVHFVQMTSFGCGPDAFIQDEIRDILRRHHKPYTLLKIDDVSNIGSLKLRVRSLVDSLNADHAQTPSMLPQPLEQTKTFKKADAHRTILAPYFTSYISPLLPALFSLPGYRVEVLPMSDQESVGYGLTYANNEICYPATLIVGDIIKALKSGKYDLNNVAVAMSQTGGQCRATSYAGVIKRAMIANGFQDVPLITLGVATTASEGGNEQEGFDIPWLRYAKIIVTSILYGDAISKMYHSSVVREKSEGLAQSLRDKFISAADAIIRKNNPKGLLKLLEQAAEEFDNIVTERLLPRVGIVGEIFLKFHPFAHQYISKHIMDQGVEVVPPLLAPFFLQEFVNVEVQKQLKLNCTKIPRGIIHGFYHELVGKRIEKINKIASRYRYFMPFTDIYEDADNAKDIVSLAAQFGEGWLLPADIVGYVRAGVNNVLSLQPFGCIANHIVAKGIEKRLRELYPQLNYLALDFDAGVSEVNVTNRLLLFLQGTSQK